MLCQCVHWAPLVSPSLDQLNLICWLKPISTRPNPFQTHLNPSQGITIQPVLTLGGCSSSPSMRSLSPNRSAYRTMICQNLSRPFQTILVQFISPQFQIQFEINWQFLIYQSQPTLPTRSLNPNKSTQVHFTWPQFNPPVDLVTFLRCLYEALWKGYIFHFCTKSISCDWAQFQNARVLRRLRFMEVNYALLNSTASSLRGL